MTDSLFPLDRTGDGFGGDDNAGVHAQDAAAEPRAIAAHQLAKGDSHISSDDERYVVSDERLVEIKKLIYVSPADYVSAAPLATASQLAGAIYDLLVERGDV